MRIPRVPQAPKLAPTPTTINFRVDEGVAEQLRQLAEAAGLSMTEVIITLIRTTYKGQFPDRAHEFETPAERFERQIMATAAPAQGKR